MKTPSSRSVSRRSFLGGASALGVAGLVSGANLLRSPALHAGNGPVFAGVTPGDINILKFLAAAELIEDDLWQQYCELAVNNPRFRRTLERIDPSLVRYICDDRDDERSHAQLINAFLVANGEEAVNLDPFRTLPGVNVQGSENRGRLTNLTALTVDTSWFNKYRSMENPDFGGTFPQLVTLTDRATIPTSDAQGAGDIQLAAHSAMFHFGSIEQGGGSLYLALQRKVTSLDVLAILTTIGPVEIYHFSVFHKSLERLFGFSRRGVRFPNLRGMRDLAQAIFPEPCTFLSASLPKCSVIRPMNVENAGAVASATALVASGLFTGQPPAFLDAVVALATAADAATRGGGTNGA